MKRIYKLSIAVALIIAMGFVPGSYADTLPEGQTHIATIDTHDTTKQSDIVEVKSDPMILPETVNNFFIGTFRLYDKDTGMTYDFYAAKAFAYDYKLKNPILKVDEPSLNIFIRQMEEYFSNETKNVLYAKNLSNGRYGIGKAKSTSKVIDNKKFTQEMMKRIKTADYSMFEVPFVDSDVVKIDYGTDLGDEITLLGSYMSYYDGADAGRAHNIHVTAQQLHGMKIAPGQTVSFLKATKGADGDLKSAYVISGGEFVLGIGGGQCQVSTTLFNAIIEAGLRVDHRRNHSLKIHYVPYGRDAMISSSNDLIFTNDMAHDIYIFYRKNGSSIAFDIYGSPKDKRAVKTWVTGGGSSYVLHRTIGNSNVEEKFYSYYGN